jgi:predicted exporter
VGLRGKTKGERRLAKAKRIRDKRTAERAKTAAQHEQQLAAQSPQPPVAETQAAPAYRPMTRRESLAFIMMVSAVVLELLAFVLFFVLWFNSPHDRVVLACGCAAVGGLVLFMAAAIPDRRFTLRETIARSLAGGGATVGIGAVALTGWWWTVVVALPIFFLGFWLAPDEQTEAS